MTQRDGERCDTHPLFLTNTLTRRRQAFVPHRPDRVSLYVCGPTVYNYAHIGNARSAVVFDLLYRVLRRKYPHVVYARNYTDVDDKINAEAASTGQPIRVITDRFIMAYRADMAALGVLAPDFEPRVTDHIPDIIAMIQRLLAAGHAYVVEGHVLFHVPSFAQYGCLSGRSRDEAIAGARIEVAPFKRDPADFVLWKPSLPDVPGWASPWGRGRPGWHIECSAMTERQLGLPIDLHGGGQDLIFPHHENEIAQSVCASHGASYCDFWVHNGFVTVDGRKMSKSLGNVVLARDLLCRAEGGAIRLALLSAHYRQPLDWSEALLAASGKALSRLRRLMQDTMDYAVGKDIGSGPVEDPVARALDDDLNTPAALSTLYTIAGQLRRASANHDRARLRRHVKCGLELLGLPATLDGSCQDEAEGASDPAVADLLARRTAARDRKDYREADRLRDLLKTYGVSVRDGVSRVP